MSSIFLKMDKNAGYEHPERTPCYNRNREQCICICNIICTHTHTQNANTMDDDSIDFHQTAEPVKQNMYLYTVYTIQCMYIGIAIGKAYSFTDTLQTG